MVLPVVAAPSDSVSTSRATVATSRIEPGTLRVGFHHRPQALPQFMVVARRLLDERRAFPNRHLEGSVKRVLEPAPAIGVHSTPRFQPFQSRVGTNVRPGQARP